MFTQDSQDHRQSRFFFLNIDMCPPAAFDAVNVKSGALKVDILLY